MHFARGLVPYLLAIILTGAAHAGQIGRDADLRRAGWYSNRPGLSPSVVSRSAFSQQFSTAVTGCVDAQPLVCGNTVLVATRSDWIYGLDPVTGAIKRSRLVGAPWNASDFNDCADIFPVVGITSTPVINDATDIAYFTSKMYVPGSSGPPVWKTHAVAVSTGAEQAGFPVTLEGHAANDPGRVFAPVHENQRTGLLLLDGVVYAAFGSVRDITPFQGRVIGLSTAGALTCRWVDRTGAANSGGGIWVSGSRSPRTVRGRSCS